MILAQSGEVRKRWKKLNFSFVIEGTMAVKIHIGKRVLDIILIGFILLMVFFPGIRTPVMGFAQRALLQTGLFNASAEKNLSSATFDYQLRLSDAEGQPLNPDLLKGKTLFINVWATWCPPCLAEMPDIAELYQQVGGNATFLMISVDRDREKARRWIEKKQYAFPIYFVEGRLPSTLSYQAIPTTWVIGSDATIRYQHSGMAQYNTKAFRDFLQSL